MVKSGQGEKKLPSSLSVYASSEEIKEWWGLGRMGNYIFFLQAPEFHHPFSPPTPKRQPTKTTSQ